MSLTAKETGGGDYKLVPEGTHIARCYLLADIGYQETKFGTKLKLVIGWEIPGEPLDDGRPMSLTAMYTNSLSEKANLRRDLESWRGRKFTETELSGFDLRNIVGKPCMITVVHNDSGGRTYANVTAVTAIPKDLPVPDAVNDNIVFDIDAGDSVSVLPEWIQRKVAEAKTGTEDEPDVGVIPDDDLDDDIPF
jgi:hypothetical protein